MSIFDPWRRSALRATLLSLLILLPGTPYIVSASDANASLREFARLAAAPQLDEDPDGRLGGAPPDEDELRTLSQTPTLSGANPPYPRNHVLDADPQLGIGTPPTNFDFESAGYHVGTPPANADLEAAIQEPGTPPPRTTISRPGTSPAGRPLAARRSRRMRPTAPTGKSQPADTRSQLMP